jgi:hypothetical protein
MCVDEFPKFNLPCVKKDWKGYRPIVRQRLGKHIPAGANALNNRTHIARQRCDKHSSSTREAVFSELSVPKSYFEDN